MTSVAPHPHAAQVWMNWITSRRAGAILSAIGVYSIRRDAATPVVVGVAMPAPGDIYNIRAADYAKAYVPFVKEWHGIFAAR